TTTGQQAILLLGIAAIAAPGQASGDSTHVVAMSDKVKLATDVYLPGDGKGKYPVIVARTPYDKSKGGIALAALAKFRGYALVVQDLRGRFKSEGNPAIIFANEGLGDH